ncbi:MAG: CBS domain-containing protein [Thaumarchaeota archaeon]|nr:CBS domain-containing protein [Nitrososphaerota archaeon]
MSLDVIHEHMSDVVNTKIRSIISKATLIEPSATLSQVINKILNNNTFDVFCQEKNHTLTVNVRKLIQHKYSVPMNVTPLLNPIPSLSENDTVGKAADIITHNRVRAVPVVKDNEIIGVVEAKNILKLISNKDNKWITATQIFTSDPVIIDMDTPLSTARRIMVDKKFDHIPVVKKDRVSQVLTSNHLLSVILTPERVGRGDVGSNKIRTLESRVGNLGTNRMAMCAPLDDLNSVIDSMLHADTTFCLVSLRDHLHGIITYRDVLNLLTTKLKSTVPLFIVGMPLDDNADIIKQKFVKALDRLQKVYPDIQEARVYIKKLHGVNSRYNYEVSTTILTPHKRHIFTRTGFELSKVTDEIVHLLIESLAKHTKNTKNRYKFSIRKMER